MPQKRPQSYPGAGTSLEPAATRTFCFFSSRRRHTRLQGDWSSDVCSSDLVITLLRQRGRLTYRTLQLQFQLDETHLEVLKDELVYGQCVAVDEAGRVLVWTGEIGRASCRERV